MEPQTSSDLMMQNQIHAISSKEKKEPINTTMLPSPDMQKFLLELIAQSNFPGSMSEFVSSVKYSIANAKITC